MRFDVVGNDVFDCRFGPAIRVRRPDRAMLWYGNHVREPRGIAVYRGGGGKDDVGDVVLGHGTEETDGAADIDPVVFQWNLRRLSDRLLHI